MITPNSSSIMSLCRTVLLLLAVSAVNVVQGLDTTSASLSTLAAKYGLKPDSSCTEVESNFGDVYQLAFDYGLNVTNLVDSLLPEIAQYFKVDLPDQLQDCDKLDKNADSFHTAACDAYRAEKACAEAAQSRIKHIADFFSAHCDKSAKKPCHHTKSDFEKVYRMGAFNPKVRPACPAGLTGAYCTVDIDECASFPCVHGECTDGSGSALDAYNCVCASGWYGATCETEAQECESSPCEHGATCVDKIAAYECICSVGFAGINCGVDIDECGSNPCKHHGTCSHGLGSYTCQCPSGTTGLDCEVSYTPEIATFHDVDECASRPCLHNGVCHNLALSYSCSCSIGYTGPNCEVEINECASLPCMNGGTCTDALGHYVCTCKAGFAGSSKLTPLHLG